MTGARGLLRVTTILLSLGWFLAQAGPLDTNLVAEFRFNGFVQDAAQPNPGLTSTRAKFTNDRLGNPNRALRALDSGFVGSPSRDYFKNRRAWTWSAWFLADDLHPGPNPGSLYSEGNNGVAGGITLFNGSIQVSLWNEDSGGWSTVEATNVIRPNVWQHLTATYLAPSDSTVGVCTIYLDGLPVASGALPMLKATDWRARVNQFTFGNNIGAFLGSQPHYQFRGALDDVLIFDAALAPELIPALMAVDERLRVAAAVQLMFQTVFGKKYQLERSSDLKGWVAEGTVVLGTGQEYSTFVALDGLTGTYWRLTPVL